MNRWSNAYRPFFPTAMLLGVLGAVAWGLTLSGGAGSLSVDDHAMLFIWGLFGTAIIGFLATAYPRQNGGELPVGLFAGGMLALQAAASLAILVGARQVAAVVGALPWAAITLWTASIAIPSLKKKFDSTTAAVPPAMLAAFVSWCLLAFGGNRALAIDIAVHGFLVAIAVMLLNRMIPFFTGKRHPNYTGVKLPGLLPLLTLGLIARIAVSAPTQVAIVDLYLVAVMGRQWIGWKPQQGAQIPLVAVLHVGMAWIVAGYLYEGVTLLQGAPEGRAALHMWTLGGLGSLLFGFTVRVTRGHASKPLVLSWDGALVMALLQVAVVMRLLPDLFGAAPTMWVASTHTLSLALVVWLVRFGRLSLLGR